MSETRNYILDASVAQKKLLRMAYEIAEQNLEEQNDLILAGIRDNGVVLANIIAGFLKDIYRGNVRIIEISLDKKHPQEIDITRMQITTTP